jgi:hypothetical protein
VHWRVVGVVTVVVVMLVLVLLLLFLVFDFRDSWFFEVVSAVAVAVAVALLLVLLLWSRGRARRRLVTFPFMLSIHQPPTNLSSCHRYLSNVSPVAPAKMPSLSCEPPMHIKMRCVHLMQSWQGKLSRGGCSGANNGPTLFPSRWLRIGTSVSARVLEPCQLDGVRFAAALLQHPPDRCAPFDGLLVRDDDELVHVEIQ